MFQNNKELRRNPVEISGDCIPISEGNDPLQNEDVLVSESLITSSPSTKTPKKGTKSYRKWFVLIAICYVNICYASIFNLTVLNQVLVREFDRSKAETSLVHSFAVGMFLNAGVVMGTFVATYGARKIGIIGGVLACLGSSTSFLATDVPFLTVTLGVTTGLGLSACFIAAATSIGDHFEGKSNFLALSFVSFGGGCGNIAYPYMFDFLTREYGWRGCLLIVGGMLANIVPCFAVCKPRTVGVAKQRIIDIDAGRDDTTRCTPLKWYTYLKFRKINVDKSSEVLSTEGNTFGVKFKVLLQNKIYVMFVAAMAISGGSMASTMIFFINFLQLKGFDHSTAIFLYFCFNIFGVITRLGVGAWSLIPHVSALSLPALLTIIGCVSSALLPTASSFAHHVILIGGIGMTQGGLITVCSVTTMKLLGMDLYSTGLGILTTVLGVSTICAGPIAGYMRDASGSYDMTLYSVSAALGVATCLYVLAITTMKQKGKGLPREITRNG